MRIPATHCLVLCLLACFTCSCKDNEPPRAIQVEEYKPGEVDQPDQTDPNTCVGTKTEEAPELDAAVEVVKKGELMDFIITLADKKGFRVCGIQLVLRHLARDSETGEWTPTGEEAYVNIPRLEPGQVLEFPTRLNVAEFPSVEDEPGPPESWSVTVTSYNDVRLP